MVVFLHDLTGFPRKKASRFQFTEYREGKRGRRKRERKREREMVRPQGRNWLLLRGGADNVR